MSRALIFVNGDLVDQASARALLRAGDVVLAADGGARKAAALGVTPSVILGDFDSLTASEVSVFKELGVQIQRFPEFKDETDLELALSHAIHAGYSPIIIIGAYGGRLDQSIGNIALLSSMEAIQSGARLDDGLTEAFFVRTQAVIDGKPGDIVSLLPWGNPAENVRSTGLLYPLYGETLFPQRTRGISNQMLTETASVSLDSGLLLCIHIRKN